MPVLLIKYHLRCYPSWIQCYFTQKKQYNYCNSTSITNQNTWFVERSSLMQKKCRIPITIRRKIQVFHLNLRWLQGRVFFDVPGSYIYLNCIISNICSIGLCFSIPLNFFIINSGLLQQIRVRDCVSPGLNLDLIGP